MKLARTAPGQRGLSLVEVLVSLFIGMLTVLAVVNLMSMVSARQRAVRAVDDAQMNALLGLDYMMQDLRMAGLGLSINELQSCTSLFTYFGPSTASTPASIADFSTAAVTIADGGSGPDTIIVRFAEGVRGIRPANLVGDMASPTANLVVDSPFGFRTNDLVMVVNSSGQCALRQITGAIPSSAPYTLAAASSGAATYNPPSAVAGGTPTWPTFLGATVGARVYGLGSFTHHRYAVTATGLVMRNLNASTDTPVAADIVDLQVQYGVSASSGSGTITQWVNATGAWAAPSLSDRKRIRAVRVALVARGTERSLDDVSPASLELWPAAASGQTSGAQTFAVPDRKLRYRVLRSVIPMKNMLWSDLS
ncbi:MAG: PilW family protein [Gemmatimonadota bacterium]